MIWKGGFQILLIMILYHMSFHAVVVFVTNHITLFKVGFIILWEVIPSAISQTCKKECVKSEIQNLNWTSKPNFIENPRKLCTAGNLASFLTLPFVSQWVNEWLVAKLLMINEHSALCKVVFIINFVKFKVNVAHPPGSHYNNSMQIKV